MARAVIALRTEDFMPKLPRGPLVLTHATLALAALVLPSPVSAAGFDAATGIVDVTDAAFSIRFEDDASLTDNDVQGFGLPNFNPVDLSELLAGLVSGGIEGNGAFAVGGDTIYTLLSLEGADLAGQRVEVVVWQKPQGTRVGLGLNYGSTFGGQEGEVFLGGVNLAPTGRTTNDGWEEWSTGPFDWAWAGAIAPSHLALVDDQLTALYAGANYDSTARALVDAVYVRVIDDAAVPASACTLLDEADTCGDFGVCHMGLCVDAAIRFGSAPLPDAGWRADYIDRRVFELDLFEGGRVPQSKIDDVRDLLADARTTTSARAYWGTLAEAYTLLDDGHASAPMLGYPSYANAGVCLHEGEADLIDGAPVTPLVFSTTGDNPIAAQLLPGDALVAIDGVSVNEWVAAAIRLLQHHGDKDASMVVLAPSIMTAALDTGAVLTFARCAGPEPCAAGAEQTVTIDLSSLGDDVIAGSPSPALEGYASCDTRFLRPVSGDVDTVTAYEFAGFADDNEGIRSVLINGVPSQYGQGGEEWFATIEDALGGTPPELLLLDQRTGSGGGVDAVDWIAGFLLEPEAIYAMDFVPALDDGDDAESRQAIVDCNTGAGFSNDCGSSFRWVLGDVAGPARGTAANSKLAVLNSVDVSGNDYLSRLITERADGETRIFGPSDTFGAFGVIWGLAGHIGELSGGSFQVHDTLFLQSTDDDNMDWVTSYGIPPTEVVRQKQSDAVQGKDTLIEAARAWLLAQ
jgi:hypothetical protein